MVESSASSRSRDAGSDWATRCRENSRALASASWPIAVEGRRALQLALAEDPAGVAGDEGDEEQLDDPLGGQPGAEVSAVRASAGATITISKHGDGERGGDAAAEAGDHDRRDHGEGERRAPAVGRSPPRARRASPRRARPATNGRVFAAAERPDRPVQVQGDEHRGPAADLDRVGLERLVGDDQRHRDAEGPPADGEDGGPERRQAVRRLDQRLPEICRRRRTEHDDEERREDEEHEREHDLHRQLARLLPRPLAPLQRASPRPGSSGPDRSACRARRPESEPVRSSIAPAPRFGASGSGAPPVGGGRAPSPSAYGRTPPRAGTRSARTRFRGLLRTRRRPRRRSPSGRGCRAGRAGSPACAPPTSG